MFKNPALAILILVLAVGTGIILSMKPWQVYREQRLLADAQNQMTRESEKSRADLVRQAIRKTTALGMEELSRQRGFLERDEVPADNARP